MARKWLYFFLVLALFALLLVVAFLPLSSHVAAPLPLVIEMGPEVVLHTPQESIGVSQPTYLVERADMEYYRHKNADVIAEYEKRKQDYPKKQEQQQDTHPEVEMEALLLHAVLQEIGADQQNVHDTTVQDTIKQTYAGLRNDKSNDGDFQAVRSNILSWSSAAPNKAKLTSIVDAIESRNSKLYNLGSDNELTVLSRVWTQGNDNVKDQVIKELLDCEHGGWGGGIVCPTGVVTRVVTASLIETPEAMPRSRNVLREEMLHKAAALRTVMEEKDSDYKALVEPEEQNSYYKEKLKEHLHEEYKGVVSQETVEAELKEWADSI